MGVIVDALYVLALFSAYDEGFANGGTSVSFLANILSHFKNR